MTDVNSAPTPAPAVDERIIELERRLEEQAAVHQSRLIHAELKSHAIKAGMVDLDGLKLVDPSSINLNSKGEVDGADRLMADLRRNKPWLFHGTSSSTTAVAPPTTAPVAKRATAMSHVEWQAARAELLRRR
jgi:hypothetical protein